MNSIMVFAFFNLGFGELFAIFVVILLLFGADKIPEFAKSLGKGIRYVKDATDGVKRDIASSVDEVKKDVNINMDEVKKNMDVVNSVKHKATRKARSVFDEISETVDDAVNTVSEPVSKSSSKPKTPTA